MSTVATTGDLVMQRHRDTAMSTLQRLQHPQIAAYIAEVKKHLRGLVPSEEAEMLLEETAYFLEFAAQELQQEGLTQELAIAQAVREYENPRDVAHSLIEGYFESEENGPLVKRIGRANALAGIAFGMANAIYLILLQLAIYFPSLEPNALKISPLEARRFLPEPIPYPDLTWQFLLVVSYPIVAPFLMGWIVGRLIPVRAASAVFFGMAPIVVTAFLIAVMLLPDRFGMLYAVFQTLFWLPVGSAIAHITSTRRRLKRMPTTN